MDFKDYYKILGLPRSASAGEIKQAYRRLAFKHHPDLHTDKDKAEHTKTFQKINEAYEVLGNAANRSKYDKLGERWKEEKDFRTPPDDGKTPGSSGYQSGGRGDETFSDFFKGFFAGGRDSGGNSQWSMPSASLDIDATFEMSLEEVMRGGERAFSLSVNTLYVPDGMLYFSIRSLVNTLLPSRIAAF